MPKVPSYDSFRVDPNGVGGQFQNQPGIAAQGFQASTTPGVTMPTMPTVSAEMAGIGGRQLQQLGESVTRAGNVGMELAARAQNEANTLQVDDALNKAQEEAIRLEYDKQMGFKSQAGFNALNRESGKPLAEEYGEKFKEKIDKISAGLGNDAQRQAFNMRANDMHARFKGSAMAHETGQYKEYSVSVAKGTVANQMQVIGLNWNNPQLIDEAINGQFKEVDGQKVLMKKGIAQAVFDEAQITGQSAEWIKATTRDRTSKAHLVALSTAIDKGDVGYANSYLKRVIKADQMDADDILKVQKVITHDLEGRQAMGAAVSVVTGAMKPVSDFDRAYSIVSRDTFTSPERDSSKYILPVEAARVSSGFGMRTDPHDGVKASHHGTDYALAEGSRIYAAGAGKVIRVGNDPKGYGNFVEIQHDDGHTSLYGHARGFNVKVGQVVEKGLHIGEVGSTGKSTGSHLHFEMRKDGKPIDAHSMIVDDTEGKKIFKDHLVRYEGDVAKAITATIGHQGVVDIAVKKAAENGSASNWVEYIPSQFKDRVTTALKEYEADKKTTREPPTLMDLHNQVRQNLGPGARPQVVRAALDEVTRMHTDYTKDRQEKDSRLEADVMRELIKNNGSWSSLSPQMLNAVQERIPGKWDDLQKYAGNVSSGAPVKTNMVVYNELVQNLESVAKITDDQFMTYKRDLSDADFKTISDLRAKYKTGDGKGTSADIDAGAINQALNDRLRMLKIDPTPKDDGGDDASRVGTIRKTVIDSIAAAQKESGKKFSDIEIAKHIDSLFAKTDVVHNWYGNGTGPVLANRVSDLSSDMVSAIKSSYKKQGISSPTDAQILSAYHKLRLNKK